MRTSVVIALDTGDNGIIDNIRESGRKFDTKTLSPDLRRVCYRLTEMFDEDYALKMAFTIRTAIELHRAWNLSISTANVLQQLKDRFNLRLSWTLGVLDLSFRIEDGLYELYRRVPFDYDSEYQDMYCKAAIALVEGHIGVHDALIFQSELKEGKYTCPSGLFFRNNPGRLILYPLQAATCCVIFFGGNWRDAMIAAICGIAAGLIDWALSSKRLFSNTKETKVLLDILVGVSTGLIGGLFHEYSPGGSEVCLKSVFLGTLYWFFYGTAFVIGFLEIIVGEYQTGVTRFLAVSVKTFVLSIGSAIGLTMIVRNSVYEVWSGQSDYCDTVDLDEIWWRYPLYLLCSISVLGQYRFVVFNYWAGLLVQLVAYAAQYELWREKKFFLYDGMDTVFEDILGSSLAHITATLIALTVDCLSYQYRLVAIGKTNDSQELTMCAKVAKATYKVLVRIGSIFGLGRNLDRRSAEVRKKLEDLSIQQSRTPADIVLSDDEEATLVEAIVEAQEYNVWSLLMPAVYQLVPGSKIALYWYNIIFPPNQFAPEAVLVNLNETKDFVDSKYTAEGSTERTIESAEYALFLTSVSLALGLILGFAFVRIFSSIILTLLSPCRNESKSEDEINDINGMILRHNERHSVMHNSVDHDPEEDNDRWTSEFVAKWGSGVRNRKDGTSNT